MIVTVKIIQSAEITVARANWPSVRRALAAACNARCKEWCEGPFICHSQVVYGVDHPVISIALNQLPIGFYGELSFSAKPKRR